MNHRGQHDRFSHKVMGILNRNGEAPRYSSYGSYPYFYVAKTEYGKTIAPVCVDCVNDPDAFDDSGTRVVDYDANWEDPSMYCDVCSKRIESAYAEDDVGKDVEDDDE